ncbi:hypothetical protein CTheo_4606 [Ceratobasidium theobromae]|uniref:Uncharacterized protein n=1 Tax=Ceratobasidium theobromae TaxID=1582974 RepID=A0A5N5QKA6_9AGAM|nr:hypothetical protein CTheo_4606 [Ceratobasidium theobromae]
MLAPAIMAGAGAAPLRGPQETAVPIGAHPLQTIGGLVHALVHTVVLVLIPIRALNPIHTLVHALIAGNNTDLTTNLAMNIAQFPHPPGPANFKDLPKPPTGWTDKDYYDRMETSYYHGGEGGRGGCIFKKVNGVATKEIKHTFLEQLKTREKKFAFIDRYGHPFAWKLGLRHFNPYGYVPQDPKVVPRIDRPTGSNWKLYVEIGALGDYDWYLDVLALIRSLVNELKPDDSVLKPSETCVTWRHFSAALREELYKQSYKACPILYHFRNQTNKDCWVVAEIARNYLSGSKSYNPKRKHIKDTTKRMWRNATKIAENAAKQYTVPSREDDPYYIKAPNGGYDPDAPKRGRMPISNPHSNTPSDSSTISKRDARRADKVITQEEERDKAMSEVRLEASKSNTSGARPKAVAPKEKDKSSSIVRKVRRIDSEEELLNEVRELVKSPPTKQTSLTKSPHLRVEVVLKSPAPVTTKPKLHLVPGPTVDHNVDSDTDVDESPQLKRKAKDMPDEPPAKEQRLIETESEKNTQHPKTLEEPKPKPKSKKQALKSPAAKLGILSSSAGGDSVSSSELRGTDGNRVVKVTKMKVRVPEATTRTLRSRTAKG